MATFPQIEDSPTHQGVTVLDKTDLGLLPGSNTGGGWMSGALVGPTTGSPTYAVSVTAGQVTINGVVVAVTGTSSLAPTSPNTADRRDLVYVDNTGTCSILAGTPGGGAGWVVTSTFNPPVKPAPLANTVVLAELYIPASLSVITSSEIVDKRTTTVDDTIPASVQTANYTLQLGDKGSVVEMNSASAIQVTIPLNASVAFPVGEIIQVCQVGVGQVTVVAPGATLHQASSNTTRARWSTITLRQRATDEWVIGGDAT